MFLNFAWVENDQAIPPSFSKSRAFKLVESWRIVEYFRVKKKTPTLSKPVFLLLKVHDKEHGAANENILRRKPKLGTESCTAASYN